MKVWNLTIAASIRTALVAQAVPSAATRVTFATSSTLSAGSRVLTPPRSGPQRAPEGPGNSEEPWGASQVQQGKDN
ncbi:unnamed protein product [Ixodes persulcatus]